MPVTPDPTTLSARVRVPQPRTPAGAPARLPLHPVPEALVPLIQSTAPTLRDRIVARILTDVAALADAGERIHEPIGAAVVVALDGFVELVCDHRSARIGLVWEHFRELGRAQALVGASTRPVHSSLHTASQVVWEAVLELSLRDALPRAEIAELDRSLTSYFQHLGAEVELGFIEARGEGTSTSQPDLDDASRLLRAVIGEDPVSAIDDLAEAVGWIVPERVVVMVAALHGARLGLDAPMPPEVFVGLDRDRAVVLSDADHVQAACAKMLEAGRLVTVAVGFPVEPSSVHDGYRWAKRALGLAAAGRIRSNGRVVYCREHSAALLREADPRLLDLLAADVLAPLMEKGPRRRFKFATTLSRWLEFNESKSALATALGVRVNTVGKRLHDLQEMYGDRLEDPDERTLLRTCLRSELPAWQSEAVRGKKRRRG